MTIRVRHTSTPVMIEFAFLIAATVGARTLCPGKSTPIDDGACFIVPPRLSSVALVMQQTGSQQKASEQCEGLVVGGLSWHLPKVDTPAKRISVARALIDYTSTHPTIVYLGHLNATDETTLPFIWLGLRRQGPPTDKDLNDESFWNWTADNSTMDLFVNGHFFWASDQPDNLGGRLFNVSEECAIAVVYREEVDDEKKLQFHDKPCAATSETQLITAQNMIAVVCTAQDGTESEEPITSKWWFIVICVAAAVVPVALFAIGFAVCYKQRRRRGGKKSEMPASLVLPSSRSRRSRRSRRSSRKKKKRKSKFDERGEDGYERFGDEAARSRTLDSFSETDVLEAARAKPFKFGFTESTRAKSTPVSVISAKVPSAKADDEDHEYNNIHYDVRPSSELPATKMPVKAVAAAKTTKVRAKTRK